MKPTSFGYVVVILAGLARWLTEPLAAIWMCERLHVHHPSYWPMFAIISAIGYFGGGASAKMAKTDEDLVGGALGAWLALGVACAVVWACT